ncbi:MAG: pilus assembly protein, partial [Bdellovibrionales bacterium]|nr:pilus assembly protein [Bdellovibrionales bacterium]
MRVLHWTLYRKRNRSEDGIGLVEIAIALPIFLVMIFGILWASLYYHAKITFTEALPSAAKKAFTRGDFGKYKNTLHAPIDCFYYFRTGSDNYAPISNDGCSLEEGSYWDSVGEALYYHNSSPTETEPDDALEIYDAMADYCGSESVINDLPRPYLYTLAYFYSTLRQSIGSQIRYPCDPRAQDGSGCVLCDFELPQGYPASGNCRRHKHIRMN